MRHAPVPSTTTRAPSGALRLGGRDCERVERLLLLRCRLHKLLTRGVIGHLDFYRRRNALLEASLAADDARRELASLTA